jgi:hypothetical protein
VLADRHWPPPQGPRTTAVHRAALAYLDRILIAGTADPRVQLAFLETLNMLTSPLTLATPSIAIQTLRSGTRPRVVL